MSGSIPFLTQLLETPSPSGFEQPVQNLVRQYLQDVADRITTDLHGNVIGVKNADSPMRVMLAGHCDQIGLLVHYVDAEGFVYFQTIGGWDPLMLIGQRVTIWTTTGPISGVIGRKPIHLLTEEERRQVPKLRDLWIDIGAKDKDDASTVVRIGDPVTLDLAYREIRNRIAYGTAMDDKCGLWVVLEAFRRAAQRKLTCALYVVSTVQEEIGLRGAQTSSFGIDPQVGIAVDVTHASDCPTIDKRQDGDIKLGGGPVIKKGPNMNPVVTQRLIGTATNIPYQIAAVGKATGTDANAMQLNRSGMAVGLVSIPNRYMHSPVEMVSLDDLENAAELLAQFIVSVQPGDNFTPS